MNNGEKIHKSIILIIFFVSYIIYLFWRVAYTIPFNFGYISIIFGGLLFIAEFVGFIESVIFYLTLWNTNTPSTPRVKDKEFPDVDIFIATYNEPLELLYKTIIGCKNMDYQDKTKVHIYICDDGKRKDLEKLCNRLNVGYITRTENIHAKAGNLNNALSKTNSPYVVTFDADMIPMHDFLIKTIPFFLTGERVGFVQVPQNFYNPDPFQYNLFSENSIPNEQNLFSKLIQAGKYRFNAIIYAGSNTVLSREALNEIGGLVVGTITEDFATGMKIQSKGYKSIYLNEIHASGLSPEKLEDLYNQRIRWGRGVVQTFKTFNPFKQKGLNFMQKLMYFSALSYWYFGIWRFIFLLSPILYSVFGIVVLKASALSILKIWLPMFILTNITFRIFTNNVRTTAWSHIYDTIMFPQITLGVLMETFGAKMAKFKVTPKDNVTRKSFINKFGLVRAQIILAVLSIVGIFKMMYFAAFKSVSASYVINVFWMTYNLYLLIMAVFFASERPKFRSSERLSINTEAYVYKDGVGKKGITYDISESGVSIVFDTPFYLDPGSTHMITISSERHSTKCFAEIIRVDNHNEKYKYVFHITKIDEENYQKLIMILYDRVPFMPEKLTKDEVIKNINKNVKNRRRSFSGMSRKLPRVPICKDFIAYTEDRLTTVHIHDYNFMYCAIKADKEYSNLRIPLNSTGSIELKCELNKKLTSSNAKGLYIYFITNYKDFSDIDINSLMMSTECTSYLTVTANSISGLIM